MIRVLSTKKLLPNQKQFLLNAGLAVVEADFISVENKEFTFSGIKDNLIFTSRNAVKAVADHPRVQEIRRNPAFCVGEKTADLLDAFGFTVQESAENASQLAEVILSGYPAQSFTFFSGNIRLEQLPAKLKTANVDFGETVVYQTALVPHKIKTALDGILFFSPSAVESFLKDNAIANQTCFCIGKTTAKALENLTKNTIVATKPSIENVIIQTINHYKKL